MLLIKYNGIWPTSYHIPETYHFVAERTYILADADLSSYSAKEISDNSIREIKDESLINQILLLKHRGYVEKNGTYSVRMIKSPAECSPGENWFGDPVPAKTLDEFLSAVKWLAKQNAQEDFDLRFSALQSKESKLESSTWSQQLLEAQSYLQDSSTNTPLISSLAVIKGMSIEQYAQSVVDANNKYQSEVATLLGQLKECYASIDASTSLKDLVNTGYYPKPWW